MPLSFCVQPDTILVVAEPTTPVAINAHLSRQSGSLGFIILEHPIKIWVHNKCRTFTHSTYCLVKISNVFPVLVQFHSDVAYFAIGILIQPMSLRVGHSQFKSPSQKCKSIIRRYTGRLV